MFSKAQLSIFLKWTEMLVLQAFHFQAFGHWF